jgi:hypothetical protein
VVPVDGSTFAAIRVASVEEIPPMPLPPLDMCPPDVMIDAGVDAGVDAMIDAPPAAQ